MARTTPIERFSSEVDKILEEYGNSVQENLTEIVTEMGKKGAAAVRSSAKSVQKGKRYPGTWKSEVEAGRLYSESIIYSQKPGLPHLLEFGHALRNGGRTAARPHIKPVEEQIIKEFESKVKRKL